MIKNNENMTPPVKLAKTIQSFMTTVDNSFIKPKREEYYALLRNFKYCKQIIKDINYIKKVKRKSIREWLWTWVLYFYAKPKSAFFALKNSKRDSGFFVNEYWILKNDIKDVDQCINELDEVLDQFDIFSLRMKTLSTRYKNVENKIEKYEKK